MAPPAHATHGADGGGDGSSDGGSGAAKRAFLRSDEAFKRQYYWLWAADRVLDVSVGSRDSHACARGVRAVLYFLAALSFASGAVSNMYDLVVLRSQRAAGESENGDTLVEGVVLTFAGACVWYAAVTALLCWWSLNPARRPLRLREALRLLPYLPRPARMAFVHRVAKAMVLCVTAWQLAAMVTVAMFYAIGFRDDLQERVSRAFTALPVQNIGHAWTGVDVVLWLLCDLPAIWSPLPSALLCVLAREHVAEFERRRLVEDLVGPDATTAVPLLRDRCVAEIITVIAEFNRRMGGAGHVTLLGTGVAAVFTVVMIGLGGPLQIAVMGVIGPVPVCAAFLFLFASVNGRVSLLRRKVGTLRVVPVLAAGAGGLANGAVHPDALAGVGAGAGAGAGADDVPAWQIAGRLATRVLASSDESGSSGRSDGGEPSVAPAHDSRAPAAAAAGTAAQAVVVPAPSEDNDTRPSSPVLTAQLVSDVVVLEAALVNVESLLVSSTGFVGVSIFATGPQVFTYQLAESFVGALASLLVLVGTRG